MKTAAYARYSSDDQRAASIRDQLRNCAAYCARMGWPEPVLYSDEAISGARADRPGYRALLAAAEAGEYQALLVDDLTRLSRDHIEAARALRLLRYAGVRVIGVSDGIDTERKGHKLEAGVRGLMGELYLDDLAEKTHRGLMGQALSGYSAGGLPYGYRSVDEGQGHTRAIDPEQARWVLHIYERYAGGWSPRRIAAELNELRIPSPRGTTWSQSAIYGDIKRGIGILANPMYSGRLIWNRSHWVKDPVTGRRRRRERPENEWVIHQIEALRIVPEHLYDAVQQRIRATRAKSRKIQAAMGRSARNGRGPKYLFSGLLTCAACGGPYAIVDRYRYGCSTHKNKGPDACPNRNTVPRAVVEDVLLTGIKERLLGDDAYRAFEAETRRLLKAARPDPADARRALRQAERERDHIMQAIRAGIITPTTKQALQDAERTIAEATERLSQIEAYEPSQILPRAREIYRRLVAQLEQIDDIPAAREAIREITGEIRLVPEGTELIAEMQTGGITAACQINMVAGARFGTYLTAPIRIPLRRE